MNLEIITIFPELFESPLKIGILGQSISKGLVAVDFIQPRDFTLDNHKSVDDRPFGGGDGMIMTIGPLQKAIEMARAKCGKRGERGHVICLSAQGSPLTDERVRELSKLKNMVLVCGRYGGIDQRLINECVDEEISVGDYVLSGGELAALILIDSITRYLPGALGNTESPENDSFANGLLEGPQFTRPREGLKQSVPSQLLSGDHKEILRWRRSLSLLTTFLRRPDLLKSLPEESRKEVLTPLEAMSESDFIACGLTSRDYRRFSKEAFSKSKQIGSREYD